MPRLVSAAFLVAVIALAGCGSSSSASHGPSTVASRSVEAVGNNPSESAKMVCAAEAQSDIAGSLGVTPTQVTPPTWTDRVYACDYIYPNGTFALSVKELQSASATVRYFDALGARLGERPDPPQLGDAAFVTTDGSVVVRKDYKVLDVDISRLPAQFGDPLQDRSDAALSVATAVMGCWVGA